jgi:heme-degrading monooxygenase HmoA
MYIVQYRWKLKSGTEDRFRSAWKQGTERIIALEGGLGSRLHQANDGSWIAYAQWPDRESWSRFWNAPTPISETGETMWMCIEYSDEPLGMLVMDDRLIHERQSHE